MFEIIFIIKIKDHIVFSQIIVHDSQMQYELRPLKTLTDT